MLLCPGVLRGCLLIKLLLFPEGVCGTFLLPEVFGLCSRVAWVYTPFLRATGFLVAGGEGLVRGLVVALVVVGLGGVGVMECRLNGRWSLSNPVASRSVMVSSGSLMEKYHKSTSHTRTII